MTWPWIAGLVVAACVIAVVLFVRYLNANLSDADMDRGADGPSREDTEDWRNAP